MKGLILASILLICNIYTVRIINADDVGSTGSAVEKPDEGVISSDSEDKGSESETEEVDIVRPEGLTRAREIIVTANSRPVYETDPDGTQLTTGVKTSSNRFSNINNDIVPVSRKCGAHATYKLGNVPEITCQSYAASKYPTIENNFRPEHKILGQAFACFCDKTHIRDEETNFCIPRAQCKTELVLGCKENEEVRHDYLPEPTCDKPTVWNSQKQFRTECFCMPGYIRLFQDQKCILKSKCPRKPVVSSSSEFFPCREGELHKTGFWPERNCANRFQFRTFSYIKKCFCPHGTIRQSDSTSPCVSQCPSANSFLKDRYSSNMHAPHNTQGFRNNMFTPWNSNIFASRGK